MWLHTVSSEGYVTFTKVMQLYAQNSCQKNTTTEDTLVIRSKSTESTESSVNQISGLHKHEQQQ